MANNDQRLIAEFDKNAVEKVKIHVNRFNGNQYLDLRVWILPDAGEHGAEIATKKGLTLHVELIPDLIQALQRAREAITGKA